MSSVQSPSDTVTLRDGELEVALGETNAVLAAATNETSRSELTDLRAALERGQLDADEAAKLERVIELALQAGRIRAIYGPGGEQAALRLYRRLPRGRAAAQSAKDVTQALAALTGRQLDGATIEVVGPGAFSLTLSVDGKQLSVRLDRQGARLASVAA
jgi:hypothetical protein